jgi:hypothetical protein
VSDDLDRPAAEDREALVWLDAQLAGDDEDGEDGMCLAVVPVTPTFSRGCGRPATSLYVHEIAPGVEIGFGLCDEHAKLFDLT